MRSAAVKDFIREIKNSVGRFLSIFFIVLLGVAFFAGLKASAPNMRYSVDQYLDEYNIMDIQVLSTLGLTEGDIEEIAKIPGVKQVQSGKFTDATTFIDTSEIVYRIHGLHSAYTQDSSGEYINKLKITEGRLPQAPGEIVIEDTNIYTSDYGIGDYITFASGTTEDITAETLRTDTFLIVGKAVSPYYLSYEKGPSTLSAGAVSLFAYVLDSDFIFDHYIESLVTVAGAEELNTFGDDYWKVVSDIQKQIEEISGARCELRANEVREMAEEQLNDAKKQYEEGKKTFETEIAKGEKELADAYEQLITGETTLEVERKNFETQYADGVKQIQNTESQLREMEQTFGPILNDYESISGSLDAPIDSAANTIKDLDSNVANAQKELDRINSQINSGEYSGTELEQLENLRSQYQNYIDIASSFSSSAGGLIGSVDSIKTELDGTVDDVQATMYSSKKQLADAKEQLALAKEQAEIQFAEAEQELAEGWISYNEGSEEFAKQRAEGQAALDAAYEQLVLAEEQINKIENAQWYVLDRNSNAGFISYDMTADKIESIAKIFPVFFFLVAALVCSTTMTRMIDEQRGTIGTYKALGYNNMSIAMKYIAYSGTASIGGGIIGVILGVIFFPYAVYNAWALMYTLPPMQYELQIPLMIISVLMGVIVTVATAYFTCMKDLKESPSTMMRPKAPKAGKIILLERIKPLWRALSFSQKVTMRNIFRYKKRFWMTVIGIAGCSALLLAGFGLSNSVSTISHRQFSEIFQFNVSLSYTATATPEEKQEIITMLDAEEDVSSYASTSFVNASANTGKDNIPLTLIVPTEEGVASMNEYISLRDRASQEAFALPETGIVLTEKLAKELGVGIGDTINVTNNLDISRQVEVSNITENYIFHYAYMNPVDYEATFRLPAAENTLLIKLNNSNSELESMLSSKFIRCTQIGSATFYSSTEKQIEDQISTINYIVYIIIICAALLAFIVLYNLTNINISERAREIATLKVLGFTDKEVYSYVYRENFILTGIGGLFGLGGGIFLHRLIMDAIEQDDVMFGYHLEFMSFIYVYLLTLGFSVVVSLCMNKRLDEIDMVESLKSIE